MIVAIVGNAAEHGGAVLVAYRGKISSPPRSPSRPRPGRRLPDPGRDAARLAIDPLALSFRQVEIAMLAALARRHSPALDGRSSRLRGSILIAAYVGVAAAFYAAGDRASRRSTARARSGYVAK